MSIITEKEKELASYHQALQYRDTYYKRELYYPTKKYISSINGEVYYPRDSYPKSLEFFRQGRDNRQRLFMAANRTGKTITAAFELMCHLTGEYPNWWEGIKFDSPKDWWVCGKSKETVQQILQPLLIGDLNMYR